MHPAYSVILFTTASGAGLGLLAWLALLGLLDAVPAERWLGLAGLACAFVLVTGGLVASTAHLGRPERAWRAFSQWRTSWLSREGVMAVATVLPAGVLAIGWVLLESVNGLFALAAALAAVCALLTLYSTGMIYASLRTIRQWHQPLTAPIYVALGLASGAVLMRLLLAIFGEAHPWSAWLAIVGLSSAPPSSGPTGCDRRGAAHLHRRGRHGARPPRQGAPARAAAQPAQLRHARDGLRVARKHALKLRNAGSCSPLPCPLPACCCRWCPAPASSAPPGGPVDVAWPGGRALAVLRRGRARRHALLRRRRGVRW